MSALVTQQDLNARFMDFTVHADLPNVALYASARIIDSAGNTGAYKGANLGAISGSYNFQVDNRASPTPSTPALLAADGTTNTTTRVATTTLNRLFTLQGTIPARTAVQSAVSTVYVDVFDQLPDGSMIKLGTAGVTAGKWALTYQGMALREGIHTIVVKGTDIAGNESSFSTALSLNVNNSEVLVEPSDRVAPTLVAGVTFDGNVLTLKMSESVRDELPANAFHVAVNGQLVEIASVERDAVDHTKLILSLNTAVYRGQQVTVA
jgi:hypothetical protein